jgi:hypothetical protein
MAHDKAIQFGKEHRKPYRKAKAVDPHCRNGKWCPYCRGNRKWFDTKHRVVSDEKIKEYEEWQD